MKLRKVTKVLGCKETYSKIENNCRIMINLLDSELDKPWYFVISHKSLIFAYNSNWSNIMFAKKNECLIAAENKLKEFTETNFSIDYDNVHDAIYK